MIDSNSVQTLRKIVADMGCDYVCQYPTAFAGAILDMCRMDDVKLLTNALRAHYGVKLMNFFRDGSADAATWMQQKTFLIDESGMSGANAEIVLDALWQAMDWHRPQPSKPDPEPVKEASVRVDPKYKKEYVDTSRLSSPAETTTPKVDPKFKKEYVNPGQSQTSAAQKSRPAERATADHARNSAQNQDKPVHHDSEAAAEKEPGPDKAQNGQKPEAQVQPGRSRWIPILISVGWVLIAFQLGKENSTGDVMTRIQNGEFQLLFYLAAPFIATVLVCAKGVPGILKGLGTVVLGLVAAADWVTALYCLDHFILHLNFLFGESTAGNVLMALLSIFAVVIGISAGKACANIRHG